MESDVGGGLLGTPTTKQMKAFEDDNLEIIFECSKDSFDTMNI